MIPLRTQVKFFVENSEGVDLAAFAPVFQRWIQDKTLDGQLIDVADYRHVFEGPGMLLIGFDSDYGMEVKGGRLGLLYTRKRMVDADLLSTLRSSVRLALTACQKLEAESSFHPRLKFRTDEIEFRFPDRLQLPNTPESFAQVRGDLRTVLDELYGEEAAFALPVKQDARYVLTVRARADVETSVNKLLFAATAAK